MNTGCVSTEAMSTSKESPPMPFRNSALSNLVNERYIGVVFRTCCINKSVSKTPLRKTEL